MDSEKNIQIEKWFAIIALIVGGILLFIIPPMASPDEGDHLFNAYTFSEANFFPDVQGDATGRMLPNCIIDFVEAYNSRFAMKLDEQYNFSEAYTSWAIESDFGPHSFKEYWNSNVSLIAYLPSGLGITIYKILEALFPFVCLTPYNLLMVGRICNLIFYVVVIYYALKWTPIMKNTIFLISLLPMSIFLASTLSYDTMIIGFCILLFSRVMNILEAKRTISIKDLIVISSCSLILFSVKQAYAPLMIVLLSLAISRFGDIRRYIKYVLIVLGAGIIPYVVFNLGKSLALKNFTWKYTEAMNAQTQVILSNPVHFIKYITNTFADRGKFFYLGCLGSLGQQDTNIPEVYLYMLTFIIIFVAMIEVSSQKIITVKFKALSLIGIFLTIYVMFAGTYIIWTATRYSIGLDYVEGCQGRYFIPLIVWGMSLFANSKMNGMEKIHKLISKLTIGTGIYISIITIICVFIRFWI